MRKTGISIVLFLAVSLSFSKKEIQPDITGTWKMDLYMMDSDTIYYKDSETYTQKFYEKKLGNMSQKSKIETAAKKLFDQFKSTELLVNKNTIKAYTFEGGLTEINIKYKQSDDKIILDEKDNQKHKYIVDYDQKSDFLTIKYEDPHTKIVNRYSRKKN
ncbi:hypothetical protein [Chryseobacterium sp. Mn2064]|uniref:hypothetical protein n=1 Tax=Chryseobacterium sp. Mn2064 TaxID=3395263 RepID=UPI003BDD6300